MKFIDKTDIVSWAGRYEAKGDFPYLISKLVYMTAPKSAQINIPSGSSSYISGWDGIVKSDSAQSYIPAGISLWEFGTDSDIKGKADDDYIKRTADPLGFTSSECTFIFVTPRLWTKKDKWIRAKLAESKWKEIRVYDAIDLEQWLDNSRPVATWFATHVNRLPFDGVLTAEQFWEEWSVGPKTTLSAETVTSGRENEMAALQTFLADIPGIKAVKASTKTEAMAFIIATAKQLPTGDHERFFSKTILIDSEGSYRAIHTNSKNPINLIPKFENKTPLYAAVSGGHHVLVPLGGDDNINQDIITLPTIRKEGQIDGLVRGGLSRDEAERYSKEAGRDITTLRRLLKFPHNGAAWLKSENLKSIIPALLVGRWNNNNEGDRQILEKLSGMPFNEYMEILVHWRDLGESPILQIGDTWRLTSPLDLWSALSSILTEDDFKLLSEAFLIAYKIDENTESIVETDITRYFTKPKKYSSWIREGLAQSLILIAHYGTGLNISKIKTPQLWVDDLIAELLDDANAKQWISLDQKLPLLSEASPDSFINALYDSLTTINSPILEMFSSGEDFLGSSSNHTGLLWALEGLAWLPEYLYDATLILLKLTGIDPGGNLSNRPDNSLAEIYKPWHQQTLAPYNERMEILAKAVSIEKDQGWNLLLRMLPSHHGVASPTHKMRWRLFEKNLDIIRTYGEINATYSCVVDLLIMQFDNSESKLLSLIEGSAKLTNIEDIDKILSFIESIYSKVDHVELSARNKLRKILSHHRSYPNSAWSLPDDILNRYQKLYDALEPEDSILRFKWFFDDQYVEFPDGKFKDEDSDRRYKSHHRRIEKERIAGLKRIIEDNGLEKTLEFGETVGFPNSVGETLSNIVQSDEQADSILQILKKETPNLALVHSFVAHKVLSEGLDWAFQRFTKMQANGFNDTELSQILIPLNHSPELWDFIDSLNLSIRQAYWRSTNPSFYQLSTPEKIRGINYLLEYNRFQSAVDCTYMQYEELSAEIIATVLEKAATESSSETGSLKEYEVSTLFEELDKSDIDRSKISKLEWLYLPLIGSYGSRYKPKHLHKELSTNPESFVQVLKWVYMPKDEKLKETERKGISDDTLRSHAEQGYRLLSDFKMIPGMDENKNIDSEFLNSWIDRVRAIANESDRIEVADMAIGKLMAQYTEKNLEYWPPDEISEVIERINTKSIKNNFSIAVTNKRGFSSRGPYDGGVIERGHAEHFKKLSDLHKGKHKNISKIFKEISLRYLEQARQEDEQAERDRLEY